MELFGSNPVLTATRTDAAGAAVRWIVRAEGERWMVIRATSPDGDDWLPAAEVAIVDSLDEAILHDPSLTELATDCRLEVRLDEAELLPEEFAAGLRCALAPDHDLPAWRDSDPIGVINDCTVHFLPLDDVLIAVLQDPAGDVVGRRRAVHRWTDRHLPSIAGTDELVEIGPGIAVSITAAEPTAVSLGTMPLDRADRTLHWIEQVVEPGILLFEPAEDEATRRDWLVAREDSGHRLEFSFGDITDSLLRDRRMAVLHPDVDVDFLWSEMSAASTDVVIPAQSRRSDTVIAP